MGRTSSTKLRYHVTRGFGSDLIYIFETKCPLTSLNKSEADGKNLAIKKKTALEQNIASITIGGKERFRLCLS